MEGPAESQRRYPVRKRRSIGDLRKETAEKFEMMPEEVPSETATSPKQKSPRTTAASPELHDSYESHDVSGRQSVPKDDSGSETNDDHSETMQNEDGSPNLNVPPNLSRRRISNTPSPELKQSSPGSKSMIKESASLEGPSPFKFLIWALILLVGIGIALAAKKLSSPPATPQIALQHCDKFLTLRAKYPAVDPMTWRTLNVSVNRAIYRDPGQPATFIFLHQNAKPQADSLLEEIISITSTCFGGRQPIRLRSSSFETPEIAEDYRAFIKQYQKPLEESGIMVVHDLDRVPPPAAQAFFTICDEYGPLVNRAVIFFTMDISERPELAADDGTRSPTALAEMVLNEHLRELDAYMLQPLVVRLTENVFKI